MFLSEECRTMSETKCVKEKIAIFWNDQKSKIGSKFAPDFEFFCIWEEDSRKISSLFIQLSWNSYMILGQTVWTISLLTKVPSLFKFWTCAIWKKWVLPKSKNINLTVKMTTSLKPKPYSKMEILVRKCKIPFK